MKATAQWLAARNQDFTAGKGEGGYAHLKHYSLEYRIWGEGPPLVLVPGLAGGIGLLGPLALHLSQSFQVITYQLRGEDDCFALRQRFGLPELAQDLAEFVDWLGIESPSIFGVSFGGMIALEFASRYPGRLDKLVLQGVGSRLERGLLQKIAGTVLSNYALPPDSPFVNQFFNLLFGVKQKAGPLFEFVTRQCWQTDQSVMAHRFRLVERFNCIERLHRVRVPTLILAGDRDVLVSEKSLAELQGGLRQSRIVRLAGSGHLAAVTAPSLLASQAEEFLIDSPTF